MIQENSAQPIHINDLYTPPFQPLVEVENNVAKVRIAPFSPLNDSDVERRAVGIFLVDAPTKLSVLHGYVAIPTTYRARKPSGQATVDQELQVLKEVNRIGGERRCVPGLTKVADESGNFNTYIEGIDITSLQKSLRALSRERPDFPLHERQIAALLVLLNAHNDLDIFNNTGYMHGHPHDRNFHVGKDFRVRLIDMKHAQAFEKGEARRRDNIYLSRSISQYKGFHIVDMDPILLKRIYTREAVERKLEELTSTYGIDITDEAVVAKLYEKFELALIVDTLQRPIVTPPIKENDVMATNEAIRIALAQCPQIITE